MPSDSRPHAPSHWTPEEFRRLGHAAVDWLAGYYERLDELPVQPDVAPGWLRDQLPDAAPDDPEAFEAILADLDHLIVPATTHWQSPNWFAYFPANASPPSVLGELISAGLGVQGMLWSTSPACTELEAHILDWCVDLLGLPEAFRTTSAGGGAIHDTASTAILTALVAAREQAAAGAPLDRLAVYGSAETHSSFEKGARIAGFRHVRPIGVDGTFAMRPDLLAGSMQRDVDAGLAPTFVCATVGTTGSTAVDPVRDVAEVARRHGAWVHVDAAFAGSAMVCPEYRWHQDGVELADSYCWNPHKWFLTNLDCSVLYVADRRTLLDALSIQPEYLRNEASASGTVIDYRDWQLALGRRFRALKLWFVLRSYGVSGIRRHIRSHTALARNLAGRLEADPRFEVVAPVPFSLVCFAHVDGDVVTEEIHDELNDIGPAYLTHTRLDGRYVIRWVVGSVRTEGRHVDATWETLDRIAPPAGGR